MYASASRSFQEARELVCCVNSARRYFPIVGSGAFDGLARPSTDRKPAKSRGKGKKGKKSGKTSQHKVGKSPNLGRPGFLPKKNTTSRSEPRPLMSKKRPSDTGTTRGGPHHAPQLRSDQCMLCRQVGYHASERPPTRKKNVMFTWQTGIWHLRSGLCCVRCHVLRC